MKQNSVKRVVTYARVSSDAQDVELSITAQQRALDDYAAQHGYVIVRRFVDEAKSGTSSNRPGFQEMIRFVRSSSHPADAIIVWKFNRFARDRMDSVTHKHLLKKSGVEVISINEKVDDSPAGRMLEGIIETVDEFYSSNLGQDIRRGMRQAASMGFFVASVPPYGYRKKKVEHNGRERSTLEVVPREAATVKRIFELADSGIGLKTIADRLNSEELLTRTGTRWSNTSLHKVLSNEAYVGTLVWGSEKKARTRKSKHFSDEPEVRVEKAWEPLVPKAVFKRVHASMKSRRPAMRHPRVSSSTFMLTGPSSCGRCGSALTGHVARSGKYRYYMCSGRNKRGISSCSQGMVRREVLEGAVLNRVQNVLLHEDNLSKLVREVNREIRKERSSITNHLNRIDEERKELQARLDRYFEAFETGSLAPVDLQERVSELKNKISDLDVRKAELSSGSAYPLMSEKGVLGYVTQLRETLSNADSAGRKSVIQSFIETLEVDGSEVRVEYHLPGEDNGQERSTVLSTVPAGGTEGIRTRGSTTWTDSSQMSW